MKPLIPTAILFICVVFGSVFTGPTGPDSLPALPAAGTSLLESVPDTALVAVQVRDLARHWSEIRENNVISQVQDAILCSLGVAPDDFPNLVAGEAMFILDRFEAAPFLTPVALLRPRDRLEALQVLSACGSLVYREGQDLLWVGPASSVDLSEQLARGADRTLTSVLPIEEIDMRLPAGGLVRGYVNPRSYVELLAHLKERAGLELPRAIAAWLEAEFSTLRYVAFRREIVDGMVLTEALAALDLLHLPPEVSRELASGRETTGAAPMLPPRAIALRGLRRT